MVEECVIEVPLDVIQNNPWQTRPIDPEHRDELVSDMHQNGLYQYPVGRVTDVESGEVLPVEEVRRLHECGGLFDDDRVQLHIAIGHHRLAAYRQLADEDPQFSAIPVKVRYLADEEMADLAMRENDERKDLNDIERASALKARKEDFGWSNDEIGRRYGLSRTRVSNLLRLLDLPHRVQQSVQKHDISGRTALALASAYGLSEVLREAIEPDTLLDAAIDGTGGNEIREILRRRVRERTVSLGDEFPPDHPFDELAEAGEVVSAHCLPPGSHRRACPLLVELGRGGTDKRCPRRSCRDTKVDAWRRQRSDEEGASSEGDLDNHGSASGPSIDTDATKAPRTTEAPLVVEDSDADDIDSDGEQELEGPVLSVDEDIIKPSVEVLAEELAALNPKTLVVLYYKMQYGRPSKKHGWSREQALQAIARKLIEYELPYDAKHNPSAALEAVCRLLRKAGAEPPWKSQEQEV